MSWINAIPKQAQLILTFWAMEGLITLLYHSHDLLPYIGYSFFIIGGVRYYFIPQMKKGLET